jgi:hypothetical protein
VLAAIEARKEAAKAAGHAPPVEAPDDDDIDEDEINADVEDDDDDEDTADKEEKK